MTQHLHDVQESVKKLYVAVVAREFDEAVRHAQAVGHLLEDIDSETLEQRSRRDRTRALAALGSALQSPYNETQETFGFQDLGRVVQNTRMLLRRELTDDEYTFDTVFDELADNDG